VAEVRERTHSAVIDYLTELISEDPAMILGGAVETVCGFALIQIESWWLGDRT
jgi:hypothetical protein